MTGTLLPAGAPTGQVLAVLLIPGWTRSAAETTGRAMITVRLITRTLALMGVLTGRTAIRVLVRRRVDLLG